MQIDLGPQKKDIYIYIFNYISNSSLSFKPVDTDKVMKIQDGVVGGEDTNIHPSTSEQLLPCKPGLSSCFA